MGLFDLAGLLVTLAAAFAFVNRRLIGLPDTIGVMLISLAVSLAIILADALYFPRIETGPKARCSRSISRRPSSTGCCRSCSSPGRCSWTSRTSRGAAT